MEGKVLKHHVFDKQYKRIFTVGDGSCLFHSLARILDLEDYTAKTWKSRVEIGHKFRQQIVQRDTYKDWLNQKGFDTTIPGILSYEEAVNPHVMANESLINFTAWRLDLTMYLVKNENETYVRYGKDAEAGACILAHINACHFEPIVPLEHFSPFELPEDMVGLEVGEHCCVLPFDANVFGRLRVIG